MKAANISSIISEKWEEKKSKGLQSTCMDAYLYLLYTTLEMYVGVYCTKFKGNRLFIVNALYSVVVVDRS